MVLFATETFAVGVNMPARSVVFNGVHVLRVHVHRVHVHRVHVHRMRVHEVHVHRV